MRPVNERMILDIYIEIHEGSKKVWRLCDTFWIPKYSWFDHCGWTMVQPWFSASTPARTDSCTILQQLRYSHVAGL